MYIIGTALRYLFDILSWAIVIRAILTWFPNGGGQLYHILSAITDPIEAPIRSVIGKYMNGPVDFSPMIAILVLMLLERVAYTISFM